MISLKKGVASLVSPDSEVYYVVIEYLVLAQHLIHSATIRAYCFCDGSRSEILIQCQRFFVNIYARGAEVGLYGEVFLAVSAGEID